MLARAACHGTPDDEPAKPLNPLRQGTPCLPLLFRPACHKRANTAWLCARLPMRAGARTHIHITHTREQHAHTASMRESTSALGSCHVAWPAASRWRLPRAAPGRGAATGRKRPACTPPPIHPSLFYLPHSFATTLPGPHPLAPPPPTHTSRPPSPPPPHPPRPTRWVSHLPEAAPPRLAVQLHRNLPRPAPLLVRA